MPLVRIAVCIVTFGFLVSMVGRVGATTEGGLDASLESCNQVDSIKSQISSAKNEIKGLPGKVAGRVKEMDSVKNDFQEQDKELTDQAESIRTDSEKLGKEKAKLADDRKKQIEEMKQALKEFKAGLYCSKCKRSKSQIERDEKVSFYKHLSDVQGVGVPAPPDVVKESMDNYSAKINDLNKSIREREKEEKRNNDRIADIENEKNTALNTANEKIAKIQQKIAALNRQKAEDEQLLSDLEAKQLKFERICRIAKLTGGNSYGGNNGDSGNSGGDGGGDAGGAGSNSGNSNSSNASNNSSGYYSPCIPAALNPVTSTPAYQEFMKGVEWTPWCALKGVSGGNYSDLDVAVWFGPQSSLPLVGDPRYVFVVRNRSSQRKTVVLHIVGACQTIGCNGGQYITLSKIKPGKTASFDFSAVSILGLWVENVRVE
jgi:predicted  nucleic acid-binding Zn-ribbon protein